MAVATGPSPTSGYIVPKAKGTITAEEANFLDGATGNPTVKQWKCTSTYKSLEPSHNLLRHDRPVMGGVWHVAWSFDTSLRPVILQALFSRFKSCCAALPVPTDRTHGRTF